MIEQRVSGEQQWLKTGLRRTTEVTKFSFHSGVSVFFLTWDLWTFCPLRVKTAKGSDLPKGRLNSISLFDKKNVTDLPGQRLRCRCHPEDPPEECLGLQWELVRSPEL
jgi:hypothetical protein